MVPKNLMHSTIIFYYKYNSNFKKRPHKRYEKIWCYHGLSKGEISLDVWIYYVKPPRGIIPRITMRLHYACITLTNKSVVRTSTSFFLNTDLIPTASWSRDDPERKKYHINFQKREMSLVYRAFKNKMITEKQIVNRSTSVMPSTF